MENGAQSLNNRAVRRGLLSRKEQKTLALTAVGGALEYFDFIVAVFFTKILASVFFPPNIPSWLAQLSVFSIFAAGYLIRPVGGLVFAHFGDKLGRKRIFALSLFLMVLPTFVMGLLPSYYQLGIASPLLLLVCRVLQGLSVGGEVPGAFIFCSEHVKQDRIGISCGFIMAGICSGILLGALSATSLNTALTSSELASWGWRIPFIAGGFAGFIAVHLRRYLQESPVFTALHAHQSQAAQLPITTVLKQHRATALTGMLGTWVFSGVFVVFFLYLPTYLQTQWKVPGKTVFVANSWSIVLLIAGCVVTGALVDRLGWAKTFALGAIGTAVTLVIFFLNLINGHPSALNWYIVTGFFIGMITVVPYLLVTSFPASVRFTGFSLSFNTAYAIFGGTAPVLMAALVGGKGLVNAPIIYILALCLLALVISVAWKKPKY
ncbi:MFS transporter [Burkholderia cenocepacia]|nr:MFS transporter [Burkholderia cenocepacia]RQZ85430.1 MFS transporter [Burkholderia cenocepacia]RRA05970.1 MFS transporter [Burkholderia cenocepacia]